MAKARPQRAPMCSWTPRPNRSLSNDEHVILDGDAPLQRYHLADGLNMVQPSVLRRSRHEPRSGDEVTVAVRGRDDISLSVTVLSVLRECTDAAVRHED